MEMKPYVLPELREKWLFLYREVRGDFRKGTREPQGAPRTAVWSQGSLLPPPPCSTFLPSSPPPGIQSQEAGSALSRHPPFPGILASEAQALGPFPAPCTLRQGPPVSQQALNLS